MLHLSLHTPGAPPSAEIVLCEENLQSLAYAIGHYFAVQRMTKVPTPALTYPFVTRNPG